MIHSDNRTGGEVLPHFSTHIKRMAHTNPNIIMGAILYVLLLLKLDPNIRSEVIKIGKQMELQ